LCVSLGIGKCMGLPSNTVAVLLLPFEWLKQAHLLVMAYYKLTSDDVSKLVRFMQLNKSIHVQYNTFAKHVSLKKCN
jgi:hypothetical protein